MKRLFTLLAISLSLSAWSQDYARNNGWYDPISGSIYSAGDPKEMFDKKTGLFRDPMPIYTLSKSGELTTLSLSIPPFIEDSVYIRNTSLQGKDWYYLLGAHEHAQKDSTDRKFFKRVRNQVSGVTNSAVVVIDSIPGKWALRFTEFILSLSGGEYEASGGKQIMNEFRAKEQLTATITERELTYDSRYKGLRKEGKDWADQ